MTNIEIPKVVLDNESDEEMITQAQERCRAASGNTITDFRVGSPAAAIIEGVVYPVSELLWFLNMLPEALALEVLRLSGVSRSAGTIARGSVTFLLAAPVSSNFFVSQGYKIPFKDGYYSTTSPLLIPAGSTQGSVAVEASDVGSQYNLPAFGLLQTNQTLTYLQSVYNSEPLTGGTDLEPLEETISRAQLALRSRNVLVSVEDYEQKAQELLGFGSKATCIPLLSANKQSEATGQVHVFLVGKENEIPSLATCQSIQRDLRQLSFVGSTVWVSPVSLVNVSADVTLRVDQISLELAEEVYEALKTHLEPSNFTLGSSVRLKELEYLVRTVIGVTEVVSVLINKEAVNVPMPNRHSTPFLDLVTVSLVDKVGYEQTYYLGTTDGDTD